MRKPVPNAFTLIELLVVISIMAVAGIFALSNYRTFGEDQNLKNAVLDLQSQLRSAQTNATTNVKCNTQSGATWQVAYIDTKTINLNCQGPLPVPPPPPPRILTLGPDIAIQSVSGIGSSCPTSAPPFTQSTTISFASLSGKITIGGNISCSGFRITLGNTKTSSTKSFIIEKGGRIYEP